MIHLRRGAQRLRMSFSDLVMISQHVNQAMHMAVKLRYLLTPLTLQLWKIFFRKTPLTHP
jgi:hypothetical protein